MFGYLYYWFACHYYKKAYKADHPVHFSAAIAVGAIQILLVYNAILTYMMFFPLNVTLSKTTTVVLAIATGAVFAWFNYKYYGGKIEVLSKKYKSCALNYKLKGWMMFLFMFVGLFLLLPLLISFVVNSLFLR